MDNRGGEGTGTGEVWVGRGSGRGRSGKEGTILKREKHVNVKTTDVPSQIKVPTVKEVL